MNNQKNNAIVMYVLLGIIFVSMIIFAITIYNGSKPVKLSENEIKITEKASANENEKIITVDAGEHVLFYSFDGGNTYQTDNSYRVSENKEVKIVLQDSDRRVIGRKTYNAKVVADKVSPTININDLPSEITKGSSIDFNKTVTAKDQNNNDVKVTTSGNVDTSKPGTYDVTYTATDSSGQTTTITTQVTVTDSTTSTKPKKKTYYRYRTKTVTSYACNYYSCDYTDHNQTTASTVSFDKNSYCCNVSGCTKTNPQISNPCPSMDGVSCTSQMVQKYSVNGNVCYDKAYISIMSDSNDGCIYKDGNTTVLYCEASSVPDPNIGNVPYSSEYSFVTDSSGHQNCFSSHGKTYCEVGPINSGIEPGHSYLPSPVNPGNSIVESSYYKKRCDSNEINIDGYCHKIDSYGTTTCPNGYVNENGTCYKRISKTCNNTCQNVSYSAWSSWSTTKVLASDTVEVQTKTE